jgi:hypothetical protein
MSPVLKDHLFFVQKVTSYEEFEDTKGVIRIRISKKNRQHKVWLYIIFVRSRELCLMWF